MNTSMNRSLARVLGPALLLTATLALPVESFGAPSPNPKAHAAMDKDGKRNKNQQNANRAQRQARQQQRAQAHRQQYQRQKQVQRQEIRRQARQQTQVQRKQVQVQRQQVQLQKKQVQLQRQQAQRQAQQRAEWQRQEARRQAQIRAQWQRQQALRNQRNGRYYYPGDRYVRDRRMYNNQYDRYYQSGERFHIDGFVFDEGGGCSLLRDHQGHVFALVGNIGDIVQGDHLRLQGRVVDGGLCDWRGTAFEVNQVKTLWDNNRHESASYDYQRDRISFEEFLDNRY